MVTLSSILATPSVGPLPTINPSPVYHMEDHFAGKTGHRTLWFIFVMMFLSTVIFVGMSYTIPISRRLYHVVTTLVVAFATLSYYAMAVGDGISVNHHSVERDDGKHYLVNREVYWARYVDWTLTTPLLLLDLCLLAGLSGGHIIITIVADVIMIMTGLFAAFSEEKLSHQKETTSSKWAWYAMANAAFLVVIWQLAVNGRATAYAKSAKVGNFFTSIGAFTLVLWVAYPIVWAIADGSRVVSVDAEIICYAVLDVLAKPIFGAWLLYTHSTLPETNIDLGGFWTHGLTGEGAIRVGDDDDGA